MDKWGLAKPFIPLSEQFGTDQLGGSQLLKPYKHVETRVSSEVKGRINKFYELKGLGFVRLFDSLLEDVYFHEYYFKKSNSNVKLINHMGLIVSGKLLELMSKGSLKRKLVNIKIVDDNGNNITFQVSEGFKKLQSQLVSDMKFCMFYENKVNSTNKV